MTDVTTTDIESTFIRNHLVQGELVTVDLPTGMGKMVRVLKAVQPLGPVLFLSSHRELRHCFMDCAGKLNIVADACFNIERTIINPKVVILGETYRIDSTIIHFCKTRQAYLIQL